MENPLVSIIIPTYNRAHLIGETLDSILAQTYTHWECIIVDDGSTDDTDQVVREYLKKDPRFKYYHRPDTHKPGGNGARNYGFLQSKGEYIQWFDSDDLMFEQYLEKRFEIFRTKLSVDIVFCAFTYFGENGFQNRVSNKYFSGNIIEDAIERRVTFSPLSYLIRKDVIQKCKFDEDLKRAQDADFFLKVFTSSKNLKIEHSPEVLYGVRKHGKSISSIKEKDGLKLNSRFIVNRRFLDYFSEIGHAKAVARYKRQCLKDLKRLLDNKNYKIVVQNLWAFKQLDFRKKIYLTFCILGEILIDRGAEKFRE